MQVMHLSRREGRPLQQEARTAAVDGAAGRKQRHRRHSYRVGRERTRMPTAAASSDVRCARRLNRMCVLQTVLLFHF